MLSLATKESENPNLWDRGFISWRLLSTDPDPKNVVPAEKPLIAEETDLLEQVVQLVLISWDLLTFPVCRAEPPLTLATFP